MKTFNWITSAFTTLLLVALFYSDFQINNTVIDVYGQPDGMQIMLMVYLQVGVFITTSFLILINLLLLFKKKNRTRHIATNLGALAILLIMVSVFWFQ